MRKIQVGVDTPFIKPTDDTEESRRIAIKEAMMIAVSVAEPGDVIYQEDVTFHRDPFESPLVEGVITMLTPKIPRNPKHWCPRAFRFATLADQQLILDVWRDSPRRACVAWADIPKDFSDCGLHPKVDHAVIAG